MVIPHTYKGKRNFRKDKKKLFTHILPTPIQHNPSTIPLVIFIVPLSFPGAAICKKKMYEKKNRSKKGKQTKLFALIYSFTSNGSSHP
jgi:hypothetical protein